MEVYSSGYKFLNIKGAYIPNLDLLQCPESFKKFVVGGCWWVVGGWVGGYLSEYSVLLWAKT